MRCCTVTTMLLLIVIIVLLLLLYKNLPNIETALSHLSRLVVTFPHQVIK